MWKLWGFIYGNVCDPEMKGDLKKIKFSYIQPLEVW